MGICKCKNCEREYEGHGNSKYCSEKCIFQSKEYLIDEETGCWNWQGSKDYKGYGHFWFNNERIRAHRFSCESVQGKAPEGKPFVLHSCDNPSCINPNHLRWGSNQENMDDMKKRNRQPCSKGEKNGMAKLEETDIIDIKEKLKNYVRGDYSKLADEYGVHYNTISRIHNGIIWTHI